MKVVVTGASGLLGRAVHAHLAAQSHEVLALANSRAASGSNLVQLDLLDTDAFATLVHDFAPDVIVHTAAERRPDVVQRDPDRCHTLNAEVPGRIASICKEAGKQARLIYISTDYVFDGSRPPYQVNSEPNPLNAYGTSKLLGERAVAEQGQAGKTTSLRVPVLYGDAIEPSESAVNILTTTIVAPSDDRKISMDAYAVRYPTNVADVAKVIEQIARMAVENHKDLPPILHFQATEAMTKYDMCNVMCRLQNRNAPPLPEASVTHLEPEYDVDPMAATSRPRHCKMDTSVLQSFGVDVTHVSFESWWGEEMEKQASLVTKAKEEAEANAALALSSADEANGVQEGKHRDSVSGAEPSPQESGAGDSPENATYINETEETHLDGAASRPTPTPAPHAEPGDLSTITAKAGHDSVAKASAPSAVPLATPSSPNPSFSSLRGRPTPPGTSDVRSPSTSQAPSLRNAEGAISLAVESSQTIVSASDIAQAPVDSHSIIAGSSGHQASEDAPPDSSDAAAAQAGQTQTSLGSAGGLAAAAQLSDITIAETVGRTQHSPSGETDDDIYGQPSPRPPGTEPASSLSLASESAREATEANTDSKVHSEVNGTAKSSYLFLIKVGDPHKVGESMTGHILYTVRTQTDAAGFRASQFSVLRRYSDFRWLHAALVHNNPGIIIPPVPEKVRGLISRFSPDLVETRRQGLERMVNKVANHPELAKDDDLKLFLESDDFGRDVKVRDAMKGPVPTPEAKTWMGWSGTVGVNSGQKFHEHDEWFDQQRAYLDSLEAQLKQMVKSLNTLAQTRKDLADSIAAHSHALLMLSASSLSRSLSACFAGLGDLHRRAQELEDIQSDSDTRHFGSVLYEYERIVGSVRKAFSTRIDCWHLMQKADDDLRRVRTKHEKVKRESAASHYYEESLKDLAEAETYALECHANFDLVSRRTKDEMKRFDRERVLDIRTAIDLWLGEQIARREELLEEWYQYSTKCLSLELSESRRAVPSQPAPPSHQGTLPKQSSFPQEQRTRTLTTTPSSSSLSRSESPEHTTQQRPGSQKDSGQGVTGANSSGAAGSTGSIAGAADSVRPTAAEVADANSSTALGVFDKSAETGGQSVQAKEDDVREGSATSPVKDPAVRQASQEVRSAAIHSNVSQVEDDNFCIGSRMAQAQTHPPSVRYGTVRYCGHVARKEGSWLGIEWDDPLRGKHDGQHEGMRYFTCSRPGRVATFIRPPSDHSATLFIGGVTFLEALEARYTHRTEEQVASGDDVVPSRHTRKTVADIDIEVPNLDKVINKVTQLTSLKTVSLTGPPEHKGPENAHAILPVSSRIEALKTLIGRVGTGPNLSLDARLIGDTVPNVSHLDLSQSLVSSWTSIASITRHLAHLRTLRLDFNRIPAPGSEEDPGRDMVDTLAHSEGFQRLKELSLNGTQIDWPHVCRLAQHLPSLEVLEMNRNCLAGIESTVATQAPSLPIFGSLQELDLSNNEIADWKSVAMALCELPELAKLNLANNKLAVIPAPDCTRQEEKFRKLASINLSGNPLLDLRGPDDLLIELDGVWASIYALDLWFTHGERDDPGVRVLKASPAQSNEEAELAQSDNPEQLSPIQQELQKWSMNLIARLPHLMTLNGTDISPRQRRDAEDQWLSTLERCLQSAEKNVRTPHGEALDILTRSLENREPRWRPLRDARGLPSLVDALQAAEQPIANTIKANLINLTLRISLVVPSAPLVTLPSERTVTAFSVLPSQTLKAVRPRILKALKIKPSVLNRAKANRDPDGEGQVKWYGVVRNGSGTDPVVFELDDDMRELAWWGFTGTRETGPDAATGSSQLADEIWLCLPEAGFNL